MSAVRSAGSGSYPAARLSRTGHGPQRPSDTVIRALRGFPSTAAGLRFLPPRGHAISPAKRMRRARPLESERNRALPRPRGLRAPASRPLVECQVLSNTPYPTSARTLERRAVLDAIALAERAAGNRRRSRRARRDRARLTCDDERRHRRCCAKSRTSPPEIHIQDAKATSAIRCTTGRKARAARSRSEL